ncbi:hypothetical protein FH972_021899 [Carpinus fangiana]|uniref:Uncharacterized protein n=1 Tax=Carpinus fangiana TaxID=176857 RepID=A0A5N6KR85_9ROSI|nr:hypothetical protein FH972_021899 [Carpinus fangiana]
MHRLQSIFRRKLFHTTPVQSTWLRKQPNHAQSISTRSVVTDKSRILEKPTRFNPPSHGSRRARPRKSYGPALTDAELDAQRTKKYPNMMPPEGSLWHWFLTSRALHLWITLSTLTSLALYTIFASFLHETAFRDQLPHGSDLFWHPLSAIPQFFAVYKLHTAHESEKVAELRRKKLDDVQKRKEFMRAHGIEPGFLTGTWMDRFGTVEGDRARQVAAGTHAQDHDHDHDQADPQSPVALQVVPNDNKATPSEQPRSYKPKRWLGIW